MLLLEIFLDKVFDSLGENIPCRLLFGLSVIVSVSMALWLNIHF